MTMTDPSLLQISDLVEIEIRHHLPENTHIDRIISDLLPSADGGEYVRTTVVLEDGHPELDPRVLNEFSRIIRPLFIERGLNVPAIAYADRSEL